jgi:general bacterial porin, GBP family
MEMFEMKKTLLAAALVTGSVGVASAQSSVTLYGVVDLGLRYENVTAPNGLTNKNGTTSSSQLAMASGQQSGSRWGIKGVEDLGDGLKASFVYESGINATTGASPGFTRQSTLSLDSNSWGGLQFGRAYSPGRMAYAGIDPFDFGFGTASLTSSQGNTQVRYSNMIQYSTPNLSGFKGWLGYSFNTVGTSNSADDGFETGNKNRAASLGLRYAPGALVLAGILDVVYSNDLNPSNSSTDTNIKAWALGGTYDFKVVKVYGSYGQNIDGIVNGQALDNFQTTTGDSNDPSTFVFIKGARTQSWMLGLSAPVGGAGKVFGSFQQRIVGGVLDQPNPTTGASTTTQSTASIGYTYDFSKRTNLYAYYSYQANTANFDGANTNQFGIGLRHLF